MIDKTRRPDPSTSPSNPDIVPTPPPRPGQTQSDPRHKATQFDGNPAADTPEPPTTLGPKDDTPLTLEKREGADHPDTNAGAPRPRRMSSEQADIPDMDHPPAAASDTATAFDRGTAAADQEARSGQRPGSRDRQGARGPDAGDDTLP